MVNRSNLMDMIQYRIRQCRSIFIVLSLTFIINVLSLNEPLEQPYENILLNETNETAKHTKREINDLSTSNHNIRFVVPDLNAIHRSDGVDLNLHAYKVEDTYRNNQWVSIGHPVFIRNINGTIYEFTPENILMQLQLLTQDQEDALKAQAEKKYPNLNEVFIYLIPLQSIDCATSFTEKKKSFKLRGEARNLNQYQVIIDIPCKENSEARLAFNSRIQRREPLYWNCRFTAGGVERFVNRLHISSQKIERAAIDHDLFGPASEAYVTRNQMTLFATKIRNELQIEEDYELDEKFDAKLVERLISLTSSSFQHLDIDQVLKNLSRFGFSSDERDLAPDEIKRALSDVMKFKKQGDKEFISVQNDNKQDNEKSEEEAKKNGVKLSFGSSFNMGVNLDHMKTKTKNLDKSNMSATDKLNVINRDDQMHIKFELDGSKIVPKTIEVALLNKNDFKRDVSVSYKKIMRRDARYNKIISIPSNSVIKAEDVDHSHKKDFDEIKRFTPQASQYKILRFSLGNDEAFKRHIDFINANRTHFTAKLGSLSFELDNVMTKLKRKTSFLRSSWIECNSKESSRDVSQDFQEVEYDCSTLGNGYFLRKVRTNCRVEDRSGGSKHITHCFECCRLVFYSY